MKTIKDLLYCELDIDDVRLDHQQNSIVFTTRRLFWRAPRPRLTPSLLYIIDRGKIALTQDKEQLKVFYEASFSSTWAVMVVGAVLSIIFSIGLGIGVPDYLSSTWPFFLMFLAVGFSLVTIMCSLASVELRWRLRSAIRNTLNPPPSGEFLEQ